MRKVWKEIKGFFIYNWQKWHRSFEWGMTYDRELEKKVEDWLHGD